ncbi:hypothetical protein [Pedobacter nutrimenti]|nr:hypothetical protein [Pedobacter nutrimenti]
MKEIKYWFYKKNEKKYRTIAKKLNISLLRQNLDILTSKMNKMNGE